MFSASYNSYYYYNDEPSGPPHVEDCHADSLADSVTSRGALLHSCGTIQLGEDQQDGSRFQTEFGHENGMLGVAHDINSDVLYDTLTRSPMSSGLMHPLSPPRGDDEHESPQLSERRSSYSSPDRLMNVSEPYDAASNELPPSWQEADRVPRSTYFTTVLHASDLQTVYPPTTFVPPSSPGCSHTPEHTWQEFEDPPPSPVPSCNSLPTEASGPLSPFPSSPQVLSSCHESEILPSPPSSTITSNPLKEQPSTTVNSSKRRATGKAKTRDKLLGIIPQDLIATLKASPVHKDKIISKVVKQQKGYYYSVTFTDGSKCCVCNISASCRRICADSRGINRHFKAAPHYLGKMLDCNHPTHPCGGSFLRRDVLTRHLATVSHPVEDGGNHKPATSGKQTTMKSTRVARSGKPY